jgi:hypothetical protein
MNRAKGKAIRQEKKNQPNQGISVQPNQKKVQKKEAVCLIAANCECQFWCAIKQSAVYYQTPIFLINLLFLCVQKIWREECNNAMLVMLFILIRTFLLREIIRGRR